MMLANKTVIKGGSLVIGREKAVEIGRKGTDVVVADDGFSIFNSDLRKGEEGR